jgi:predicted ATP-dependent endonuclease of OLD family
MHIESVTLTNFRCFGPVPVRIELDPQLTAMIGSNGTGKSAALEGLLRLFGITQEQRRIRVEDFHVPAEEDQTPESRDLSIEVVLAFPELDDDDDDAADTVTEFRSGTNCNRHSPSSAMPGCSPTTLPTSVVLASATIFKSNQGGSQRSERTP